MAKNPQNRNFDDVVASTNKKLDELLGNDTTMLPSNQPSVDGEMSVAEISLPGYKSPLPGVGNLGDHLVENYLQDLSREAKNEADKIKMFDFSLSYLLLSGRSVCF